MLESRFKKLADNVEIMVSLDDLKAEIQEENRKGEIARNRREEREHLRVLESERTLREEERVRRLRERLESERWGTPESIHKTLNKRAEKLMDIAGFCVEELRDQEDEARRKYRNTEFTVTHRVRNQQKDFWKRLWEDPWEKLWESRPEYRTEVHPFGIDLFLSCKIVYLGRSCETREYVLEKNGEPLALFLQRAFGHWDPYSEHLTFEFSLKEVVDEIFKPKIRADEIERGESKLVRACRGILSVREPIKQVKVCYHGGLDEEDKYVYFMSGKRKVIVPNPFYERRLERREMDLSYIKIDGASQIRPYGDFIRSPPV